MIWCQSFKADPLARGLADRHYNRQKHGSVQFVPPGRSAVFLASTCNALWISSWPQYAQHAWDGAWLCTLFRNEGAGVASELIRDAVACTRWRFGDPPEIGMVSFIDRRFVRPIMVRGVPTWGRTFYKAGFVYAGETQKGLMVVQLHPADMPKPQQPGGMRIDLPLFGGIVDRTRFQTAASA